MDVVLPDSPEAWAFATLAFTSVFGAITGAIAWAAKRWADRRVAKDTAVLTEEATLQAALAKAQERLITAAERREADANARTDKALGQVDALTTITTELIASNKLILEEVRRGNGNYESLVRELAFRSHS